MEPENKSQTRIIYKRPSLLLLASENKLKLFCTLIAMLVLILNILQQLTERGDVYQKHQSLMNNTPIDHCPFEKIANNEGEGKSKYYYTDNQSSIRLRFCFGPLGPMIELRHFMGGKQMLGGIDVNPFQFRYLFTNTSAITEHFSYILYI